jgi:hypothetical protein
MEASMTYFRAIACAAFAASAAAAGPYDQPYSRIEAADRSEVRKEFSPAITRIDGKSTDNPRRPAVVAPGKHSVTVRFETGRVTQSPEETSRVLEMDLEPCTLYRIAARRVGGTEWEPKVYSEPIGECVRKFKKAG